MTSHNVQEPESVKALTDQIEMLKRTNADPELIKRIENQRSRLIKIFSVRINNNTRE